MSNWNDRLDRLKTGLNLDKIEDDIEEDKKGRSKDKKDEKSFIKTVPNFKNILGFEMDQGPYTCLNPATSIGFYVGE